MIGLIAGGFIGALGVAAFGVIHALAIVPIWDRLLHGLLFAVPSGALLGWAFIELHAAARGPTTNVPTWGFGFLVWLTLLPSLVLANTLRLLSVSVATRDLGDIAAVVITALTALGVAHHLTVGWKAKASFAIAACGLLAASAGPIPIVNGPRARALFVGVSVLWLASGALLALLIRVVASRSGGAPQLGQHTVDTVPRRSVPPVP